MRCPKCNYISFDHNQVCPKCEKDITMEQAKLNLPLFLANPPFLLASLIGDVDEIQGEYDIGTRADGLDRGSSGFSFDDTTVLEGASFDETQDVSMSLEDDEALKGELDELHLEEPSATVETAKSVDSSISGEPKDALKGGATGPASYLEGMDDEITLDFEEPSVSDRMTEIDGTRELAGEKELDLDLGELTIDEADETLEMGGTQGEGSGTEKATQVQGTGEIELSLDDLKIDDTGELLIGDDTVVIDSDEIASELEKRKGKDFGIGDSKVKGENLARDLPDEAPTLESESIPVEMAKDEELNIDLDDLDLELDLDEPEGKKT